MIVWKIGNTVTTLIVNDLTGNTRFFAVFGGIEIRQDRPQSAIRVLLGWRFQGELLCNSFYMRFFLLEPPCGGGLRPWSFAPGRPPEEAFNENLFH
jgi:hypothetical protein